MVVDDNPLYQNEINPRNDDFRSTQFPTMVVIKHSSLPNNNNNKDLSIFPPINHENLHLFSQQLFLSSSSSSSASSSSFSPSDSDQSDPESPVASQPKRPAFRAPNLWLGIGLEALRLRALRFGGNGVVWWKGSWGWAFGGVFVAAMAMVWSLWQRRRILSLVSVVKERDEKINQLLHQIAQLNEVLIARHKLLVWVKALKELSEV